MTTHRIYGDDQAEPRWMRICAHCRHYTPAGANDGLCQRYPPVIRDGQPYAVYPQVHRSQSCGEFQPRRRAEEPCPPIARMEPTEAKPEAQGGRVGPSQGDPSA